MTKAPRGSDEQLTGDFYAGCMNEAQANSLGAKPIEPLLARDRCDPQRARRAEDHRRAARRADRGAVRRVRRLRRAQPVVRDRAVLRQRARHAGSRLLPEGRRTLQGSAREVSQYVQRLFALAGSNEAQAKAAAETVVTLETRSRAGVARQRRAARSAEDRSQDDVRRSLQKLTPAFDWQRTSTHRAAAGRAERDRAEASCRSSTASCAKPRSRTGRRICARTCSIPRRRRCPTISSRRSSRSASEFLNGAREMKPRWKRCAEATDSLLGDALGRKYVEKYFPPEAKARMLELVKNLQLAMKETIEGLEWMGAADEGACAGEAQHVQSEDRLPRQVEGLQLGRGDAATRTGSRCRGAPLRRAGRSSSRSTSRSIAAAGSSRRRPRTRTTTRR